MKPPNTSGPSGEQTGNAAIRVLTKRQMRIRMMNLDELRRVTAKVETDGEWHYIPADTSA